MDPTRARAIQYGLGILLVLTVVWAITQAGGSPETDTPPGGAIERITPTPGSQVPRQQPVVVDLAVGYEATLFVRSRETWTPVAPGDVSFEPATGVLTWRPPDTVPAGPLHLRVEYHSVSGAVDVGSYEWDIRTY